MADVRIVRNVDLAPEDLKIAQLREARMLGRWNERSIEPQSLLTRERFQRPGPSSLRENPRGGISQRC